MDSLPPNPVNYSRNIIQNSCRVKNKNKVDIINKLYPPLEERVIANINTVESRVDIYWI